MRVKFVLPLLIPAFLSIAKASSFDIHSKNPQDRILAIFYLSKSKNPSIIPRFCKVLLSDKNKEVRKAAADVLGYYGNSTQSESCLLKAFGQEESTEVKYSILSALETFKKRKIGKLYCKVLEGNYSVSLKREALKGLSNYLFCREEIENILKNKSREFLTDALFAVSLRKDNFPSVKAYLSDSDVEVRKLALKYFVSHKPDKDVISTIKKRLIIEHDPENKALMLEILLSNDAKIDENLLLSSISNGDVAKKFVLRLPFIRKNKFPFKGIKLLLKNENPFVVSSTLTYLGTTEDKKYCSILLSYLMEDGNETVRNSAIWSVSKLNCSNAFDYLASIISDFNNDDRLRLMAARSFLSFDDSTLKEKSGVLKSLYESEILDDVKEVLGRVIKESKER